LPGKVSEQDETRIQLQQNGEKSYPTLSPRYLTAVAPGHAQMRVLVSEEERGKQ